MHRELSLLVFAACFVMCELRMKGYGRSTLRRRIIGHFIFDFHFTDRADPFRDSSTVLCSRESFYLVQCSPQAVQPRPGPLGLAWLAGLVGLVLAPSRLGTRRDRSESWTEYGQGLRAIPIWLQSTLYWALGRAPPGLPGLRVPPAWYPGQPRPGFLYGLWGALTWWHRHDTGGYQAFHSAL